MTPDPTKAPAGSIRKSPRSIDHVDQVICVDTNLQGKMELSIGSQILLLQGRLDPFPLQVIENMDSQVSQMFVEFMQILKLVNIIWFQDSLFVPFIPCSDKEKVLVDIAPFVLRHFAEGCLECCFKFTWM